MNTEKKTMYIVTLELSDYYDDCIAKAGIRAASSYEKAEDALRDHINTLLSNGIECHSVDLDYTNEEPCLPKDTNVVSVELHHGLNTYRFSIEPYELDNF